MQKTGSSNVAQKPRDTPYHFSCGRETARRMHQTRGYPAATTALKMVTMPSICGSILFFSRPRSEGWPYNSIPLTYFLYIPIDSSTGSPVHVLMLSIQAMRGLPHLRALHCSLQYLFLQATPFFLHGVTIVC